MSSRTWIIILVVVVLFVVGGVVVRRLSETETGRLERLRPEVRAAFERLRQDVAAQGIELYVISTRRTEAEQAAKVSAGLSTTQTSWHLLGRAIDFNVQTTDGATGKVRSDNTAQDVYAYEKVQLAAHRHGFRGVPNGSPFKADGTKAYLSTGVWDPFHLEYSDGLTFAQAKARDAGVGVA